MYLCSKDNKNLTYLMYNIYFGKRCITLCTPDEKIIKDPNAVILRTENKYNYSQIIEILESSPAIRHLMIYTESEIDSEFNRLRALFKEINAGGGVIENENKEFIPKIEQVNPFTYYDGTLSDKLSDYKLTNVGMDRMRRFVAVIKENGFKYTNAFIGNLMEKNVAD